MCPYIAKPRPGKGHKEKKNKNYGAELD